jgi:PAS domain S-box-containing protein
MPRFSLSSLRVRLILLVFTAAVPAFGLMLQSAREKYNESVSNARAEALRLVRVVSQSHRLLLDQAHQLLFALSELPGLLDPSTCHAILKELPRRYAGYTNFSVIDPKGNPLCSAIPLARKANFADRDWFQTAVRTRDYVISDHLIGRISDRPVIVIAYPITDAGGRVRAVLSSPLRLDLLNQLAANVELPAGAALTLTNRRGMILVRAPAPEQWVGKSAGEAPIVRHVLTHGDAEGIAELPGIDGITRSYAFTSLQSGRSPEKLYLFIGLAQDRAQAMFRADLGKNLAWIAFLSILSLAATWTCGNVLVIRPIESVIRGVRTVARGDFRARTWLGKRKGEIGQLADAFDEMAQTLETRQSRALEAENALKKAHSKYERLIHSIEGIVWEADAASLRFSFVSQQAERMLGCSPERWTGEPAFWADHLHPDDRERAKAFRKRAAWEKTPRQFEYRMIAADGSIVWVRDIVTAIQETDQPLKLLGVIIDITERKRLEEAILEIGDQERQRIGLDLHDSLGQHLTGIAFMSKGLAHKLLKNGLPEAEEAKKIAEWANQAISQARNLARGLYPVELSRHGLIPALEELAANTRSLFHVSCELQVQPSALVPNGVAAMHLYRITQEALDNAIRHGRARRISIHLTAGPGTIELRVRDDGSGVAENGLGRRPGMGIPIMKYRAGMIGGSLEIYPGDDGGTVVTCAAPNPTA